MASAGLWWQCHRDLLEDLEDLEALAAEDDSDARSDGAAEDLASRRQRKLDDMEQRLREHRVWLLDVILGFKRPNATSNSALKGSKLVIDSHSLELKDELRNRALQISKHLDLDEIQSYILLSKYLEQNPSVSFDDPSLMENITIAYFLERQCLLKCTRLLLTMQCMSKNAQLLIEKGLEKKALQNLKHVVSDTRHEQLEPKFATAWADEIVTEESLVLDIIFLIYSDHRLSMCTARKWNELFKYFQELVFEGQTSERLPLSQEAEKCLVHVRCQALLILIEALDVQLVLTLVHAETPFSGGGHPFPAEELHELDATLSGLDLTTADEYAPLLLAWATFIALVSSLPDRPMSLDIEHAVYAQQAYKSGAFDLLLNAVRNEQLKDSELRFAYNEVVKTLSAASIAAYDFCQSDMAAQPQIIDLLCETFEGQESLCTTFWDKDVVVDGPIRSFLFSLRDDYPQNMGPLLRLLTCLCEGPWSAECVYNFLSKSIPFTCLYRPNEDEQSFGSIVHTSNALQIATCSALHIPAGTAGHVLKQYNDGTALVRWECEHSALIVIILWMVQWPQESIIETISRIVSLLNKMISSNKDIALLFLDIDNSPAVVTARADGRIQQSLRIDVINIACSVIKNLLSCCPGELKAAAESVSLLQKFANSFPERVMEALENTGLIQACSASNLTGDPKLTKLEQSHGQYCLTMSVLDMATALLDKGVRTGSLSAFVHYTMHSTLANHSNWKFKERHDRWLLSSKICWMLQVTIRRPFWYDDSLRNSVLEGLSNDTIIHGVLFQILTINSKKLEELYIYRLISVHEVDTLLQAICSAMTLIDTVLEYQLNASSISGVCQFLFYKSSSSPSIMTIITSYFGYLRCTRLQILSARIVGKLCEIGNKAKPQAVNVASYLSSVDSKKQIRSFLQDIFSERVAFESPALYDSVVSFVTSAIAWQPGMVGLLITPWPNSDADDGKTVGENSEVLDAIWSLLTIPTSFSMRYLEVFSHTLTLLVTLWQGGSECLAGITVLRTKKSFLETLSLRVVEFLHPTVLSHRQDVIHALCRRCQALILQIMVYDMFIHTISGVENANTNDLKSRLEGPKCALSDWISPSHVRDTLAFFVSYNHTEDVVLRARAEARWFVVGLLVKLISSDVRGLDVSFTRRLYELSSQILQHPSFRELIKQYSSHGYRHTGSIERLVLNDLYYNLQGESCGRSISNQHFQELSSFLVDREIDMILIPSQSDQDSRLYDVISLRNALGLEAWNHNGDILAVKAAEQMLYNLETANDAIYRIVSHVFAVNSLVDLVNLSGGSQSKAQVWTSETLKSSVKAICTELEKAIMSSGPTMDRALYMPEFLGSQSKLLAALMCQFVITPEVELQPREICRTTINTSFNCIKYIWDSQRAKDVTLKDLFSCLLMALEVISTRLEKDETDIGSESLSFLPLLCNIVEEKEYRCLALATINILIKFYLVPSTWLPVLQAHFPTKSLLSSTTLGLDEDQKTCSTVMSFCLYLSCFKGGAEMLFTAGFLQYILMIKEDNGEGPFSMSKNKSAVWTSGVAIVSALLRALGDNEVYRGSILDGITTYVKAERHKLLSALCSPNVCMGAGGRKMVTYQRAQTSVGALQEAQYVAALLCAIVRYPIASIYGIRDELVELREMVVHLLAYMAREAVVRPATGEGISCPPLQKQELLAHTNAATLGTTSAWFLLSARGSNRKSHLTTGNELVNVDTCSGTAYSELVAIQVYKLVNLLLRFLGIQARQALQDMEEGRSSSSGGDFPDLPAPEILHALQDQALVVTTEIASSKAGATLSSEVGETCRMLLSVLEKSLFLEACISRVCGVTPVSLRADDFAREFKALLRATAGHASLDPSLTWVKEIASLVYPS